MMGKNLQIKKRNAKVEIFDFIELILTGEIERASAEFPTLFNKLELEMKKLVKVFPEWSDFEILTFIFNNWFMEVTKNA